MSHLAALPVAVPFIAAALLVAAGAVLPHWLNDGIGVSVAASVLAICVLLAHAAAGHAFAYWLGGWRPHAGVALGIALNIDPLGAGAAAFASLMVLAAFLYALRYFDDVGGMFHVLMLMFLMGMAGFCLTGDLFDLVVFFELMSVVAYALTAYRIEERAPIQGAINFAVTNSIGGYAMFIGVALLYGRTGALNMAQIGAALDGHHLDSLVIVAMVLIFLGFLTKAAVVPLHFWLADAHAVAPVPVCVLFSGVMVELGLYAVARVYWVIFAGVMAPHVEPLRAILIALGVMTGLVACSMCFLQRHIKRLLAFSTISHIGLCLCGIGLLDGRALAGVVIYVVAHGLIKAALFMLCGTLLHRYHTVDEYALHGRAHGGRMPIIGVLFLCGGLLLAALPPFTLFEGKSGIEGAASAAGLGWLAIVFAVISGVTGGAVLRITGRVFLGWGPSQGPDQAQERAAEESVDETEDDSSHTPPMMVIVPAALLVLAAGLGFIPGAIPWAQRAAELLTDHHAYAAWVLHGAHVPLPHAPGAHVSVAEILGGCGGTVLAVALAGIGLFGRPLREGLPSALTVPPRAVVRAIRQTHSGHIGDYIAWWTTGAAAIGAVCLLSLR